MNYNIHPVTYLNADSNTGASESTASHHGSKKSPSSDIDVDNATSPSSLLRPNHLTLMLWVTVPIPHSLLNLQPILLSLMPNNIWLNQPPPSQQLLLLVLINLTPQLRNLIPNQHNNYQLSYTQVLTKPTTTNHLIIYTNQLMGTNNNNNTKSLTNHHSNTTTITDTTQTTTF